MTPIAVERDSRTFKQAASLARLGHRSIVFEGEASAVDAESLPFELVTMPNAEPMWGSPGSEDGEHPDGAEGEAKEKAGIRSAMARVLGEAEALRRQRDWNRSAADAMPDGDLYLLHSYPLYLAVRRRSRDQSVPYAYDAHDSYFELHPDQGGPWQRLWALIERRCVRGAAGFATVSEGLADLLEERQGRRPEVIRNAHDLRLDQPVERDIRAASGVGESDFLVVCVGNDKDGMTVDQAFVALTRLPDDVHLACVGRGHEHRRDRIAELGLEGRVHLVGPARPTEIVEFISAADAAAVLYRPLTRTYLHALPNGLFQSIAAGLPILYPADLTDLAALATRHGFGRPIDAADPASIAARIEELHDDPELRRRLAAASEAARETENWEHEEKLLDGYIDRLLGGNSR